MRKIRKYTVKEWKRLYKIQDKLCQKYEVILTDYKTRREKIAETIAKINFRNFNTTMISFNKIIQDFGGSMEKLTAELNESPKNNVKIWPDKSEEKSQESKDKDNLDAIWGKRK